MITTKLFLRIRFYIDLRVLEMTSLQYVPKSHTAMHPISVHIVILYTMIITNFNSSLLKITFKLIVHICHFKR